MAGRRKRILQISETNTLEKPFLKSRFEYRHFNYKRYYDDDMLIEMWQRIPVVVIEFKPDIILLNFKHEDCINEREREFLEKVAVVLDIL